jgi:hypothetical protein
MIAGTYGGGFAGPYNAASGTYGLGANYGFAKPYQGKAAGTAVVFMPAAFAPNAPNITYQCPLGVPAGSMLTAGIPCGVPVTSVPAAWLPTTGGLPAGVDLSKIPGVSQQSSSHFLLCEQVSAACQMQQLVLVVIQSGQAYGPCGWQGMVSAAEVTYAIGFGTTVHACMGKSTCNGCMGPVAPPSVSTAGSNLL